MTRSEATKEKILALLYSLSPDERDTLLASVRRIYRFPIHPLEAIFGVSAEVILEAIHRGTDLTQRGVRGMIAEAVFETDIAPKISGWKVIPNISESADFTFEHQETGSRLTVQIKLQRREKGVPKRTKDRLHFVVEVQKTRSGVKRGQASRPYRFGDFDILAVCMQPSTGQWTDFHFVAAERLAPRRGDPKLIEKLQPVPSPIREPWYNSLSDCLASIHSRGRS